MRIMVNGLPGNMATKVAEHVVKSDDMELIIFALTGSEISKKTCSVNGREVDLIKPEERDSKIKAIIASYGSFISVDFTQPSAIEDNIDFYCRNGLPFVCGTTGGKRDSPEPGADNSDTIQQKVRDSGIVAVIAPNMAKQIVALQAFMENYARRYPNAMKGYELAISESHQKGKKDTSGTAKAMIDYFNKLGIPFEKEQITMIREPDEQREIGIPEEYLSGHGWHTYEILAPDSTRALITFKEAVWRFLSEDKAFRSYSITKSSKYLTRVSLDETVTFHARLEEDSLLVFSHNVNGRDIYVPLDAIRFLQRKVEAGEKGKVYSMIDVLKGE